MNFLSTSFLLLTILSSSIAYADTPRQSYLQSFNYQWDMRSDLPLSRLDAPFFGTFPPQQLLNFYNGCMDDWSDFLCSEVGDSEQQRSFYSEQRQDWHDGDEPWFLVMPYNLSEIQQQPSDWAYIPMCNAAFNTLEYGFIISNDGNIPQEDLDEFETELRVAERTFTMQFLDYIGADQLLRDQVLNSGLLSIQANEFFRNAWLNGRLSRPAIVIAVGECGAGGNEVEIAFSEPTVRFQIITDFDYLICERLGLDPWNANECTHVRDQLSNLQVLSGRYRARITRQSGQVIFREIDINDSTDTELNL